MDAARKVLLWRRLKQVCEPRLRHERSRLSLESLNPTRFVDVPVTIPATEYMEPSQTNTPLNINEFLDVLCREQCDPIDFNTMLCNRLLTDDSSVNATDVFKVAVAVPRVGEGVQAEGVFDLLHRWIGQRLQYGEILSGGQSEPSFHVVRSLVVRGCSEKSYRGVDMVLLVVPPVAGGLEATSSDVTNVLSAVPSNVPLVALNLNSFSEPKSQVVVNETDAEHIVSLDGDDDGDFDGALRLTMDLMAKELVAGNKDNRLIPLSVRTLVSKCVQRALRDGPTDSCGLPTILQRARATLEPLLTALEATADQFASRLWPSVAFADSDGAIEHYFGPNAHLPSPTWHETLRRQNVEPCVDLADYLLQQPLPNLLEALVESAPLSVASHCQSLMTARMYRSCLTEAFEWWPREQGAGPIIFVPGGMVDEIVNYVEQELGQSQDVTTATANISPHESALVDFNATEMNNTETLTNDASIYSAMDSIMRAGDGNLTLTTAASVENSRDETSLLAITERRLEEGILARSKRALDSANEAIIGSPSWKKPRQGSRASSASVEASKAFTLKLQALLGS
uniref:Uncharacterized protein n=1 Tax=Grammatophora oceanica TaxID=210454 RepID=A0A7S1UM35_9STRA|mmetsp:Transcript_11254/g.16433  ORF Transcript_11254/g.16433 Transcript_11254/m.16433 type:complete len:569 (+) Transcript_11254:3-1709(+)